MSKSENGTATLTKLRRQSLVDPKLVLTPGYVLDEKFELLEPLGKGGAGLVFKAAHLLLNATRVVKILSIPGIYDEDGKRRFQREAGIITGLRHENIVEVSDADISKEGFPYIVMPFLEGESLREWTARTPPDKRDFFEISRIVIGVAEGLYAAHSRGIIHRDIKPGNIFLHKTAGDKYPTPVILDFGASRNVLKEDPARLTQPGQSFGTQGYMSPEQHWGDDPDEKSDIYSLGAVLYHLLTDEVPSPAEKTTPPDKINPQIPKAICRACLKAMEPNPEKRFENAEEFAAALCQNAPGSSISKTREKSGSRGVPIAFGAAGVLLGLMLGAVFVYPDAQNHAAAPLSGKKAQLVRPAAAVETPPASSGTTANRRQDTPASLPSNLEDARLLPANRPPADGPRSEKNLRPKREFSRNASREQPQKTPARADENASSATVESADAASYDAVMTRAKRHLENADFKGAERAFEAALGIRPDSAAARHGLATVAKEKGDLKLAAERLEAALKQKNNGAWRLELALLTLKLGNKKEAAAMWRKIANDSSNNEKIRERARTYLKEYDTFGGKP